MVGNTHIDLSSLNMEELSGVVNLYPWFASARKELCRRMALQGGDAWGVDQYGREALFVGDREQIAALLRTSRSEDCRDSDVQELLRSLLTLPQEAPRGPEKEVRVVGGDYFSQRQYEDVRREGDSVFARFATKASSPAEKEEGRPSDIASRFATETLAEIFAEQGCIAEARQIYSRLILDNPEKSAYFASLIEKLNEKI